MWRCSNLCDERGHLKADCARVQATAKDLRRQRLGLFAKYGILTGRMTTHFGFERVTIACSKQDTARYKRRLVERFSIYLADQGNQRQIGKL